jgi:hypothetical protein
VGHARRATGHLQISGVWPGYQVTYRVNEAYALIGTGAADQAVARFRALCEVPLPRYLTARVRCLADLAMLTAALQRDPSAQLPEEALAGAIRNLRELEWPSVMHLLPQQIGLIFGRALARGIESDWVCAAIRTRRLPAPADAPEAWPWTVRIRALGTFEVYTESGALLDRPGDARKAASKPLELLRFPASSGLEMVAVDKVARELWPGDGRVKATPRPWRSTWRVCGDCSSATSPSSCTTTASGSTVNASGWMSRPWATGFQRASAPAHAATPRAGRWNRR